MATDTWGGGGGAYDLDLTDLKGIGPDFEMYLETFVNCITDFYCSETVNANVNAGCIYDLFFNHKGSVLVL